MEPDTARFDPAAAYQLPVAAVVAGLESDPERGLTGAAAQQRLERYGRNELPEEPAAPAWRRFLAQFTDVLVVLLLIATAVSAALWVYERDTPLPYEALVIFAIVLLNGILGYVQEARAERAVAALRAMAAAEATALRDGERRRVPAADLVPGDVILLEEGDTVPADGRLLHTTALQTAEATLTGESLPVSKGTEPVPAAADLGDRTDMVYSGTAATYGRGRAMVTATGQGTEMGRIAGLLRQTTSEPTPLQRELDRTGRVLGVVVLLIAAVVVAAILVVEGAHSFNQVVDALILGVALAVAAVPEGLPAVVTAVLSVGVQRMAARNTIVRRLPAVETLGSATTIASDKTGTLTRNEMTVRTLVTASGRADVTGTGYAPQGELLSGGEPLPDGPLRQEVRRTLRAADRANNATLQEQDGRWRVQGDPTEGALLVAARKAGLEPDALDARFGRVGEVPFSSERKLMSTVHLDNLGVPDGAGQTRTVLFSKGAPDVLLTRCTHELVGEESRPLTDDRRRAVRAANEALAGEALRTLGIAFRTLPEVPAAGAGDGDGAGVDGEVEHDLVFLGLVGMIDPPRAEVGDAVQRARGAGIRPIMITGDHPLTALAIARELGIAGAAGEPDGGAITGADLERLSDEALAERVQETSVYARVNPEHKLRIVRALQADQQVVAMTGDGVNDAPALKTADIGIAMGVTGTDVSKEAADMVLADDNFATIVAAIEEGRSIFDNIQKFLRYLLSSNVGEVLTMFLGVIGGGLIGLSDAGGGVFGVLPLLATQILWVNLVTDGPPALALGLDPPDRDVMRRQPRPRGSPVITPTMWSGIVFVGLVMAVGCLYVLDASLTGGLVATANPEGGLPYARTMLFTTLVLFQLFNVFNARSDEQSAFPTMLRNRWLWWSLALSLALQTLVIYVPFLQNAFQTVPLSSDDWTRCILVASSVLWLREISKLLRRILARDAAARAELGRPGAGPEAEPPADSAPGG
ncbi:MAG TPA: cation-translocating P-type ATPase [Chloroflexota bacterium]|nr:cation-translocating P-type ATPase [Chloroflexota bacterium]